MSMTVQSRRQSLTPELARLNREIEQHAREYGLDFYETFFHTRESGGTVISSAYELCNKIIEDEYPQELWNTYVFHFSDGDNWSGGDTDRCINILKTDILPKVNLFGYGQVESTYGSGQFIRELESNVTDTDKLVLSRIENKDDIYQSIKEFLGKGE